MLYGFKERWVAESLKRFALHRYGDKLPGGGLVFPPESFRPAAPRFRVRNTEQEPVPAGGVMQPRAIGTLDGQVVLDVGFPGGELTAFPYYLVNAGLDEIGPAESENEFGWGDTLDRPGYLTIDDPPDNTPTVGEYWGPQPGKWAVARDIPAYLVLRYDEEANRLLAIRCPSELFTVTISKDTAAQVGSLFQTPTGLFPSRGFAPNGALFNCQLRLKGYDADSYSDQIAEEGRAYLARFIGLATVEDKPYGLLESVVGDQEYLAKAELPVSKGSAGSFRLHHRTSLDASDVYVTAKAIGHDIPAQKWAFVARIRNSLWLASLYETT